MTMTIFTFTPEEDELICKLFDLQDWKTNKIPAAAKEQMQLFTHQDSPGGSILREIQVIWNYFRRGEPCSVFVEGCYLTPPWKEPVNIKTRYLFELRKDRPELDAARALHKAKVNG